MVRHESGRAQKSKRTNLGLGLSAQVVKRAARHETDRGGLGDRGRATQLLRGRPGGQRALAGRQHRLVDRVARLALRHDKDAARRRRAPGRVATARALALLGRHRVGHHGAQRLHVAPGHHVHALHHFRLLLAARRAQQLPVVDG